MTTETIKTDNLCAGVYLNHQIFGFLESQDKAEIATSFKNKLLTGRRNLEGEISTYYVKNGGRETVAKDLANHPKLVLAKAKLAALDEAVAEIDTKVNQVNKDFNDFFTIT